MRSFLFACLITSLLPLSLYAQSFAERMNEAYTKTDKNFELQCFYSRNKTFKLITPLGETIKSPDQISREFQIENNDRLIPMTFIVARIKGKFEFRIDLNKEHTLSGKLSNRSFFIPLIKDQSFASEFETSRIMCRVNFAEAYPHVLEDGNYHISVHPHKVYDWQSRLKASIENYLNDPSFTSIIMLESNNRRGDVVNMHQFFDGVDYKIPPYKKVESDLVAVPEYVPLIVSPAGNSRFTIKAENQINITFTGGNHNYCIWNVTRHVIEDLMQSRSSARINFYYDTNSIVAQPKGIEGEGLVINFRNKDVSRSNLLKDLLASKEVQSRYHTSYLQYFRDFLAKQYAGMYKTYKINYKAEGFETSVILEGTGTRNLEINLTYI